MPSRDPNYKPRQEEQGSVGINNVKIVGDLIGWSEQLSGDIFGAKDTNSNKDVGRGVMKDSARKRRQFAENELKELV